jgi:hypothetical protein
LFALNSRLVVLHQAKQAKAAKVCRPRSGFDHIVASDMVDADILRGEA